MQREIGSNFWLDPNAKYSNTDHLSIHRFHLSGSDAVWLSTGRSSITYAIRHIRPDGRKKIAVLPYFTCHTVIQPFINEGYEVIPYSVREDLTVDPEALIKLVKSCGATVLLFHHYFGFRTFPSLLSELHALGATVIEDRTQCLYSAFPAMNADYTVSSLRKWCGVPDGGFAICREGSFDDKPSEPDEALEAAKLKASYAKFDYIRNYRGEKNSFLQFYKDAEEILTSRSCPYRIGKHSALIQQNLDVEELKRQRRSNFSVLLQAMRPHWKLPFCELPDGVVPLYFPFYAPDRAGVQAVLRENDIYAPIVWPQPEQYSVLDPSAQELYAHLLCIPIDQRYDTDDMQRVLDCLERFQ